MKRFPHDYFGSPYEEPWYLEEEKEERDEDDYRDLMNELKEDSK